MKRVAALLVAAGLIGTAPVLSAPPAGQSTPSQYRAPRPLPFEPSADMFTLAELVSKPATKAILESIEPALANSGLHNFLGYYTVPQLRKFFPNATTPEKIAKLNAALAQLPRSELPGQ